MIKDRIENIRLYAAVSPAVKAALEYIAGFNKNDFCGEKVEIDGKNVFALQQSYRTGSPDGRKFESHRKYVDIQFVLEGSEAIRVADTGSLDEIQDFNTESDIGFHSSSPRGSEIILEAGDFAVLFPHDAHMPQLAAGRESDVKKIVVKASAEPACEN